MAILALVLAFVFAPAGLILGIIARKQIRQTGEEGSGLALAGIIVGGIATALFVLMFIFMIVPFPSPSFFCSSCCPARPRPCGAVRPPPRGAAAPPGGGGARRVAASRDC